jgi:hypothetical protein
MPDSCSALLLQNQKITVTLVSHRGNKNDFFGGVVLKFDTFCDMSSKAASLLEHSRRFKMQCCTGYLGTHVFKMANVRIPLVTI